jgi:hypothetical protein
MQFVNKQEVNLCAIQRSTKSMFVQVVFRPLRNKRLCYFESTMDMARVFFTKIQYTFVADTHTHTHTHTHKQTHTRARAIKHWHFSSYFHGLLTVTDSVCCLGRPTKMLLEQDSNHNTLTRLHRIYDGHHFFQSLVVPKDAGQVTRHWTPEVSISALSKVQYACSDFVIISHYIHTGL